MFVAFPASGLHNCVKKKMCASAHIPVLLSRVGAYRSFCGVLYDTRRGFYNEHLNHTKIVFSMSLSLVLAFSVQSQKEMLKVGHPVGQKIRNLIEQR